MGTIKGDQFRFETISIQNEGSDPPEYTVFRVPIPLETQYVAPEEGSQPQSQGDTEQTPVVMSIQQNAVTVRPPFRWFIERNIEKVEKKMGVRMSLNPQGNSLVLIASGDRAQEAINEMLNMCRTSNVYNYYLCFPVRGAEFQNLFDQLKMEVQKCLGGNVTFEMRPHVTLALLNLVTDEDVDAVVKALQATTIAVSQLSIDNEGQKKLYTMTLDGVEHIKYKGKAAKRSVFMTAAKPDETLSDIATEFQDCVKRAMNKLISKSNEKIRSSQIAPRQDNIGKMTEAEAAARGIFITPGGNIEITYTDIALVDPNGVIDDQQLDAMLAEVHSKDFGLGDNQKKTKGGHQNVNQKGTSHKTDVLDKSSAAHKEDPFVEHNVATEYLEPEPGNEYDLDEPDYDPSVTNKLHVTLLRNQNVDKLNHLKFTARGTVCCVELRARGKETCSFKAYTKTQLVRFVGHRYDGKPTTEHGVNYITGTAQPDLSVDLITDHGATKTHNSMSRFVFWF
ncbi:2,3-bisphosphoglycerate-independent phosphoglycerate mutase, putative [Babesia ovis]|uniref:2,3-bisphosphoglycerate-independent phosphoglycerate mutase, putative n=1 Tax=Babesia ovis TaxID=5869 RepID=A0A9W5T7G3_BABOV|nr:2,3-bisphosphoglycerate-independent phosphoglycerate mutase, putative [Babesia ovis]